MPSARPFLKILSKCYTFLIFIILNGDLLSLKSKSIDGEKLHARDEKEWTDPFAY